MYKRKGWNIQLHYTTGNYWLYVRDNGPQRKAVFYSLRDAAECERVLWSIITASHY